MDFNSERDEDQPERMSQLLRNSSPSDTGLVDQSNIHSQTTLTTSLGTNGTPPTGDSIHSYVGTEICPPVEVSTASTRMPMMNDELRKRLAEAQGQRIQEAKLNQQRSEANAWMDGAEENHGDDDEASVDEFNKAEEEFKQKKHDRTLTDAEEIAFMRLQSAHKARLVRAQQDQVHDPIDDTDGLFLPFTHGDSRLGKRNFDSGDGNASWTSRKRSRVELPADAEEASVLEGLRADLEGTKGKARQTQKRNKKAKATNAKPKPRVKAKPKAKGGEKRGAQTCNIDRLMTSNVFRDAQTNTGREEPATFTSTQKNKALKELIASIPEETRSLAHMDQVQVRKATNDFTGHGACKSDGHGGWLVKGMISSLSHYQMIGAAVMRRRETGDAEPRGGLLADAMGLGKTVMTIANIVNGRPPSETVWKSTLIVATTSLVFQWMQELEKHGNPLYVGSVTRYTAAFDTLSPDPVAKLREHDIIVTTYSEVARSYPKNDPPPHLQTSEEKSTWWKNHFELNKGVLHRLKYHRVVLDECQLIKNFQSARNTACCGLISDHRWALSGTPIQNRLSEFYSFFKFLRVPHATSMRMFKKNFLSKDGQTTERLQVLLNSFMIRRTHSDTLLGAKLLVLPKPTQKTITCEFSKIERQIYDVFHKRFIKRINDMSRSGQLGKKYSFVFAMLSYLRQMVDHILLVQDAVRDLLEKDDFDDLEKITHQEVELHSTDAAVLQHLRFMLRNKDSLEPLETASQRSSPENNQNAAPVTGESTEDALLPYEVDGKSSPNAMEAPVPPNGLGPEPSPTTTLENPALHTGGAFGLRNDYGDYLQSVSSGKLAKVVMKCVLCRQTAQSPQITSCNHIYCYECLLRVSFQASKKLQDLASCFECQEFFTASALNEAPSGSVPMDDTADIKVDGRPKSKAKTVRDVIDQWIDADGKMLPSSKTMAIKAQVLNWLAEDPTCKIIIYTQFNAMMYILSRVCDMEKWSYCMLRGDMSSTQRTNVIKEFQDDKKQSIMLASLKSGGVGLNLTMANRVIVVDLWWNSAVEQQEAFCRTYRRGQDKQTQMTRFVVRGTVEPELVKMQEKKDTEISTVLSDEPAMDKKISTEELLQLFGPTGEDADGNTFIFSGEHTRVGGEIDEDGDDDGHYFKH